MRYIKIIFASVFLALPLVSYAQAVLGKTSNILNAIGSLIGRAIPIVFALALLLFFWGVAKYILSAGTEKDEGKKIMVWGVVALFVMASIWGLVTFIRDSFLIDPNATQKVPAFSMNLNVRNT